MSYLKRLFTLLIIFQSCPLAAGQWLEGETNVVETGFHISARRTGYEVNVAIVLNNPYEDRFATRPAVRVTLRAADGSVMTTREISSAGIPPKNRIAFCESLFSDEMPAKVEFRPLSAEYEMTTLRESDFLPFELVGVHARDDAGRMRITGEIKNPYSGETGVWITLLYRDGQGKLLGGSSTWISSISASDKTPFEFYVDNTDYPPQTKSIERSVFSHNNYQDSWHKLLHR